MNQFKPLVFYYECEVRMKTMQKMSDKEKFTPIKLVDVSHILKTHRKKPKFPVTALRFALSTLYFSLQNHEIKIVGNQNQNHGQCARVVRLTTGNQSVI